MNLISYGYSGAPNLESTEEKHKAEIPAVAENLCDMTMLPFIGEHKVYH